MMRCQNCFAELRESEAVPSGEKRLNPNIVEQFFYVRCPRCEKLWHCKRVMLITNMEVEQEVAEI